MKDAFESDESYLLVTEDNREEKFMNDQGGNSDSNHNNQKAFNNGENNQS